MYDPNTMTVSEVITAIRNVGILVTILVAGWKARALVQPILDFLSDLKRLMVRGEKHMDAMEESMSLLLTNHLTHIGKHVRDVRNHQVRASGLQQVGYEIDDADDSYAEAVVAEAGAQNPTENREAQV